MKGLPTPTAQQPPLCHPPHDRQRPALPLAGRPRPASASSQPARLHKSPFSWRLRQWQFLVVPRFEVQPLRVLQRDCRVPTSNFCQLIMATLKFYKHLLIDYDRHLTTYTEQFFSCFLLLQPSGPCFYLPPYSWRLPASYPVQQAPDSVCVSMGPGLSRALLYDFYCRFIFTVSLQEIRDPPLYSLSKPGDALGGRNATRRLSV